MSSLLNPLKLSISGTLSTDKHGSCMSYSYKIPLSLRQSSAVSVCSCSCHFTQEMLIFHWTSVLSKVFKVRVDTYLIDLYITDAWLTIWLLTRHLLYFIRCRCVNPASSSPGDWRGITRHFSQTGVIRKGSPSIKLKMIKIFGDKISLTGCKWSSMNAPRSHTNWSSL